MCIHVYIKCTYIDMHISAYMHSYNVHVYIFKYVNHHIYVKMLCTHTYIYIYMYMSGTIANFQEYPDSFSTLS